MYLEWRDHGDITRIEYFCCVSHGRLKTSVCDVDQLGALMDMSLDVIMIFLECRAVKPASVKIYSLYFHIQPPRCPVLSYYYTILGIYCQYINVKI